MQTNVNAITNPRVYSFRAKELAKTQPQAAIALLEQGLAAFPDNIFMVNKLAHLHHRENNIPQAIHYLELAHKLAPQDILVINTLGSVLSEQEEYVEAENILARGRRMEPNNVITINILGHMYLRSKNYAKYEKLIKETLSFGINHDDYLYLVAKGMFLQNDIELARRTAYNALLSKISLNNTIIYMACCADQDKPLSHNNDAMLAKLRRHFGDRGYRKLFKYAINYKQNATLLESVETKYAPNSGEALADLSFMRPVNHQARGEALPAPTRT